MLYKLLRKHYLIYRYAMDHESIPFSRFRSSCSRPFERPANERAGQQTSLNAARKKHSLLAN